MRLIFVLLGLIPLFPVLLPLQFFPTSAVDLKVSLQPTAWVYGVIISLLIPFLVLILFQPLKNHFEKFVFKIRSILPSSQPRLFLWLILFGVLIATIISSAFNARPHLVDSIAQLFQAKVFASGHVKALLPAYPEFFYSQNLIYSDQGVYSQYPPVHALILALGIIMNCGWIMPAIISTLGILIAGLFYQLVLPRDQARYATIFLIFCPFYQFLGASLMNHSTSFLTIALFVYFSTSYLTFLKPKSFYWAMFSLGFAFATRPLEAVAVSLPFTYWIWRETYRHRPWKQYAIAIFAVLPGICIYFGFNALTSGDPLQAGYLTLWGESHSLGFHSSPWGIEHTPWLGLQDFLIDWKLLNEYLLETPWPPLILLFVLVSFFPLRLWDRRLVVLLYTIPVAYFFYWHRDSFLGPRFLYPVLLFLVPLIIRSIFLLVEFLGDRYFYFSSNKYSWRSYFIIFLVCSFVYVCMQGFPGRLSSYSKGLQSFKVNLPEELKAQGVEKALVFIPVSFGHRLISRLRGAGVSASLVEQVYRSSDHCELFNLIRLSEQTKFTPLEWEERLRLLMKPSHLIIKTNLTGDPTFRHLKSSQVSEECLEELRYDLQGFSIYAPFFPDNQPDFQGAYVFATDLREHNQKLIEKYPNYPVYLYRKGQLLPRGTA